MELSWSTCIGCDVSAANGATEAQQADYLTRAFEYRRRYLSDYVERIFWFELRDNGTDPTGWDQNHGLVRRDFSPKPALAAFRALGVEDDDGVLPPTVPGTGPPVAPATLPAAAARLGLPTAASSPRGGRTTIGRTRLTLRKGVFTLRIRLSVRGGRSAVRVDGYRGGRWRFVKSARVRGTGTLTFTIRDRGFVGFRIRATVPGLKGFRVGRVVRVPAKSSG